ncbi:unnamed protein product [Danaus chrysippus]|uniref:(African queen) hypothetical protein n=1 Tax=Danaus chrysippus TaxID=151541 RepID=A0A8J2W0H1_9NEOP|nr:unnamed protein product [Danaus chrysippus]
MSQCVGRQIPYKTQIPETVLESPGNCQQMQLPPAVIENTPIPAQTQQHVTLITDCTPSVCKNLANTIQLMIVVDLLKNGKGSQEPVELALSLLNDITNSPTSPCGCTNPFFSNSISSFVPTNPNIIPSIAPKLNQNSFFPNFIPSNAISGLIPGITPFTGRINPNALF